MAISKQLQDEANRTISGISAYYDKYGDSLIDAEEREHRISKVTAALEGCNGLTEKEKIQKTAENLFGLTCTWERDSLALKRELIANREATEKAFEKMKKETAEEFTKLGSTVSLMTSKLDTLGKDLEKLSRELKNHAAQSQTAVNSSLQASSPHKDSSCPWHYKIFSILDNHFGTTVLFVIVFMLLLIISGNLDWLSTLVTK